MNTASPCGIASGQRVPGGGGLDGRLRDERDRHGGCAVRDPGDLRVPGQADAAGERGGEVVAVALELDALREELLGARGASLRDRGGHEPEGDHRGARAEPALARDRVREGESLPLGRRDAREGAHAEMVDVDLAVLVSLAHLELVPEVERGRRAVEAGAEVRRARRGADASKDRHRDASSIASGSGVDDDRRRSRAGDRGRVLETVAGQHADDAAPGLDLDVAERRETGGRRRLAEEPFVRQLPPRGEDRLVPERHHGAAR